MTMRAFKVKNVPPPGSKKVGDWLDKHVKLKRAMTNGYATFPVGAKGVVTSTGNGLTIKLEACPCCGIRGWLSRIHGSDVELIEREDAK
jgi:hypothetical protein